MRLFWLEHQINAFALLKHLVLVKGGDELCAVFQGHVNHRLGAQSLCHVDLAVQHSLAGGHRADVLWANAEDGLAGAIDAAFVRHSDRIERSVGNFGLRRIAVRYVSR